MAGGRAGVKKMNIGGVAKTAARSAYKAKTAPLQAASMVANKVAPKSRLAKGLQKAATPFKVGGKAKKAGKSIGPAESAFKKALEKAKTSKVTQKMAPEKKKMGGRAGVVKMMNGGDPLSKRGVKMGMSMSPSKNKGKGLYGK